MPKKTVKTWGEAQLYFVLFLLELAFGYILKNINIFIMLILCVITSPGWLLLSSYICMVTPAFHLYTFDLFLAQSIPDDEFYGILLHDDDGYLIYHMNDKSAVSTWLIDHPIKDKGVIDIWNSI